MGTNGVLKIELDNQNTSRTSEYSFGELRMSGVHIHYVLYTTGNMGVTPTTHYAAAIHSQPGHVRVGLFKKKKQRPRGAAGSERGL
jgi:hypothetical protein